MFSQRTTYLLLFSLTLVLAMLLSVYPLPLALRWWRPEFVLMMVIYWIYTAPVRTSLLGLCVLGFFLDVLEGVPFGQHGLSLIIIAYVCILSYQRVRNYSVGQQSCWVFVLIGNWVQAISGRPVSGLEFLLPAFASACFWPVCYLGLERLRRRYRIAG
jgi:rod shape-determining protein MreD